MSGHDDQESLSLTERCRRALAAAGEPMSGREVADALGETEQKERNRVYNCLSANACLGDKGIESIEGKYTITPGWTRQRAKAGQGRRTNVPTMTPAAVKPEPPAMFDVTPAAVVADAAPTRIPPQPTPSMGAPVAKAPIRRRSDVIAETDPGDFIGVERKVLRTLLVVVLEHSYKLTDEQREAVLQVTRQAA